MKMALLLPHMGCWKSPMVLMSNRGLMSFLLILLCLATITNPFYIRPDQNNTTKNHDEVLLSSQDTTNGTLQGQHHYDQATTSFSDTPLGQHLGEQEEQSKKDNQIVSNQTKAPGANQRAVHRKRRHRHHYKMNNEFPSSLHLLAKRESSSSLLLGSQESLANFATEEIQQLCHMLRPPDIDERNQLPQEQAGKQKSSFFHLAGNEGIALANQCRLYVRIKHPLFKTQRIGYLVVGIQYQVELNVEGSGCQNELSVYQNSAASRPYFILATYSKYGSINGGFRHVNCTEDENEVLSVIPAAGLGAQTLAYIPSEKSSDSISFSVVRRQRALKTDDHEEHTNRNSNNVTNVHRTINLPVINECLLSLNSMVDHSLSLSLADLMVPMLQTQSKGWKPNSRTHTCNFHLPPALYYSIISHAPKSLRYQQTCQVKVQFSSREGRNLTENSCLHDLSRVKGHKNKGLVLKMTIANYDDASELVARAQEYSLQSWPTRRVTRDSKFCQGDLVKFEEGLNGVVNYDYHSGDCVAKLHLPYGYATQLQFQIVSDYSNTSGDKFLIASPNCTYTLGNNLVRAAPTSGRNQLSDDDGWICYQNAEGNLILETNQVTLRLQWPSKIVVKVGGLMLPHLVGNCQQGGGPLEPELWLQMGSDHCVKVQKEPKGTWITAQQVCQANKGHLVALHNRLDEQLLQTLIFSSPQWSPENGIWIGASDTRQEGIFAWSDGSKMDYSNWFPGWSRKYGGAEPSSRTPTEDCVELRQSFPGLLNVEPNDIASDDIPTKVVKNQLYWNDQECRQENWFVCSKRITKLNTPPPNPKPLQSQTSTPECSIRIQLKAEQPYQLISSDEKEPFNCTYHISAAQGAQLSIEFHRFHLNGTTLGQNADCLITDYFVVEQKIRNLGWRQVRRYCGDWKDQLKAIHVVTKVSVLRIQAFLAPMHGNEKDKSRGFVAKVISTPKSSSSGLTNVTLVEGTSGSIHSTNFPLDYPPLRTQTTHIVGPKGTKIRLRFQNITLEDSEGCNSDSIVVSDAKNVSLDRSARICGTKVSQLPHTIESSVYTYESLSNELWVVMRTDETVSMSGYFAVWEALKVDKCENKTFRGLNSGFIESPGFPNEESSRFHLPLDCWTIIDAPISKSAAAVFFFSVDHRVVLSVETLDFFPIGFPAAPTSLAAFKSSNCGSASSTFLAFWMGEGQVLCLDLDATTTSLEEVGPRRRSRRSVASDLLLEKTKYSLVANSSNYSSSISELVSSSNKLAVRFFAKQGNFPGRGFRAKFKIESFQFTHTGQSQNIQLNKEEQYYYSVNYPSSMPRNLKYRTSMIAPSGTNLQLIIPTSSAHQNCTEGNFLQIEDPYRTPSKMWQFCQFNNETSEAKSVFLQSYLNMLRVLQVSSDNGQLPMRFKVKVKAVEDEDVVQKVLQITKAKDQEIMHNSTMHRNSINNHTKVAIVPMRPPANPIVDTCDDNLCFNGGFCDPLSLKCRCRGHFIGRYCLQTSCDLHPCQNGGLCSLTSDGYLCSCPLGFGGPQCERRLMPCETEPCVNGICIEDKTRKDGYRCQCHLWWIGPSCERRIKNIPFKPLSERMMEEPFWLGLLAVFVVLGILGAGYTVKKHLPDKFDRLITEDGAKTQSAKTSNASHVGGLPGGLSLNTQMSLSEAADAILGSNDNGSTAKAICSDTSPGAVAKNLLGKITMRKASILSVSSIGSFVEKKSCSSTEELYPGRKSPRKNAQAQEEERRKILKMLVTPQATKRTLSSVSFDSMVIKAARSAENVNSTTVQVSNGLKGHHDNSIIRKESSSSLQIPGLLRRTNSDSAKSDDQNSKKVFVISSEDDFLGQVFGSQQLQQRGKVTFSQVVDQMACSFSESSSLSDLSSCTEDFKHSVSSHVPSRRGPGKLMRSGRISKRARRQQQQAAAGGYFGRTHPLGQTSGSEDLYESSMESIESNNATIGLTLHPLSALNPNPSNGSSGNTHHSKKLQKISSADSLMCMIKNLAANRLSTSTPSSPQLSDNGDNISSGGFPTPLTTPDTPCANAKNIFSPRSKEQKKQLVRKISSSDLGAGGSVSSSPSMSPTRGSSQIMVEVLDPLNPRKGEHNSESVPSCAAPTITLEVPGFSFSKCLSPIKELPSPMPTPIPSPIPFQRTKSSQDELSSSSSSSGSKSSNRKAAANLLSKERRSSFTTFCKKAANAGKRSSGTPLQSAAHLKSSMSTSDEDMIPLQEIKIHVPMILSPQSNIPLITITEPTTAEELDETTAEEFDVPEIAVSPPSPRPNRKEFKVSDEEEELSLDENIDVTPQVTIMVISPPQTPILSSETKPLNNKFKPPPISIPNSNFRHYDQDNDKIANADEENIETTNVPKDAMSKPDQSLPTSSRMSIELGERRSKAPNAEQEHTAAVKVKLVKQKDIFEERKCLYKQSENVSRLEHGDSLDSPSYLIPPLKFDSTPRSRSQSVELPEAMLGIPSDQNRKLSLVNTEQQDSNIHVIVQPPTPQVFVYPRSQKRDSNKDEGLAALMRSRSAGQGPGSGKPSKQSWTNIRLGSPPAKKGSEVSFQYPSVTSIKVTQVTREQNKDLSPGLGPAITITPMSELESDADTSTSSMATATKGMTYLSPFTIITTCASRTASESNLSSSGYSSMASPGPSRSGSSNPLCISESEDTSTPTRSTAFFPKVLVPPMMPSSAVGGGGSIFIKRPHTLMKSPSADSESSDPIKVHHPSLSNAERRRQVMLALRYRTDSETTDEQCIPESISETHDSAVESAEDIIDEEEDDEDKSPNTEAVPQINLEVQSSTESDKTVLSFKKQDNDLSSAPNSPFSCSPRSSSHNLRQKLTLTLPEIVVEPCSPPATSPSAESSPTTFQGVIKKDSCSSTTSSSSSLSLGPALIATTSFSSSSSKSENTAATVADSGSGTASKKATGPIKSSSVPPLMLSQESTSIEYEQLSTTWQRKIYATSAPMSASSSRSESPMSDRYCGKCSSLMSLHLRNTESDSDLIKTNSTATQTRPQSKGKSKKNSKFKPSSKKKTSLEIVDFHESPHRRAGKMLSKRLPLKSFPGSTCKETSSSNESLKSSPAFDLQRGYHTDHSSADESGQDDPSGLNEPVTSPPVSSPSCSSLKSGTSNSNSKQGSPRGSTLHIPATASGKRPQLKRTRKKSSKSSSCALKTSGSNEIEAKDSV